MRIVDVSEAVIYLVDTLIPFVRFDAIKDIKTYRTFTVS